MLLLLCQQPLYVIHAHTPNPHRRVSCVMIAHQNVLTPFSHVLVPQLAVTAMHRVHAHTLFSHVYYAVNYIHMK